MVCGTVFNRWPIRVCQSRLPAQFVALLATFEIAMETPVGMIERRLTPLADTTTQTREWVWANRIPIGAITILEGDPGQGKTTLVADVVARLTSGRPMPNCQGSATCAGAVLVHAEDDVAATLRPALEAGGADVQRIQVYDRTRFGDQPLVLPDDLNVLEVATANVRAKLMVLDPLSAFLGTSTNSEQGVRRALAPLTTFAERNGVAVLAIRHLKKSGGGGALYRGLGSIGVIATARSVLLAAKDIGSDNPHDHVLVQTKSNLAAAAGLRYRTVKKGEAITIQWLGECEYNPTDLMAGGTDQTQLQEAAWVLYSFLAEGAVPAKEVINRCLNVGVAKRTLDRAKKVLGVRSRKRGSGRYCQWFWELSADASVLRAFKERDTDELLDQLITPPDDGEEDLGPDE